MITRRTPRWILSISLAALTLIALSFLLTEAPLQARPVADLLPCSGSIQACIDAASAGDTILIAAGRYTESLTLSKPVSLTGKNRDTTILHAIAGHRILTVTGAAIDHSVVISGLAFISGTADYGGGVLLTATARPQIRAVLFAGNTASVTGGGLHTQEAITLADVIFVSNTAEGGGGVYAATGPVEVTGGRFEQNVSQLYGGGLWVRGQLNMSGTVLLGNRVASEGGGGAAVDGAAVINGRFENNQSGGYGGGLSADLFGPPLYLTNTQFISNSANGGGGGVAGGWTVFVTRSLFISNHAASGGALLGNRLYVSDTSFLSNTAGGAGAVGSSAGPSSFLNCRFVNNRAVDDSGGGLVVSSETVVANSFFEHNIARREGGGLYASDTITLSNVDFISNTVTYRGGGALAAHGVLFISGSNFISNFAPYAGGVLAFYPTVIVGSRFVDNLTSNTLGGGGLFARNNLILSDTEFINNRSYGGGGLMHTSIDPTEPPPPIIPHYQLQTFRSRFEGNDAVYGGALAIFYNHVTLSATDFISNSAQIQSSAFLNVPSLAMLGGRVEGNKCAGGFYPCDLLRTGPSSVLAEGVTINGTKFINNDTLPCGGLDFIGGDNVRIVNGLFAGNTASGGAPLCVGQTGNTTILHSTFVNPTATHEPAIEIGGGSLYLRNNIFSYTTALSNTGGAINEDYDLFTNLTGTVSFTSGAHSLVGDPKFVDPLNGDYHLQFGSSAIDRGVNAKVYIDLDGNSRPHGASFDIGAYEYVPIYLYLPVVYK